MLIDNMIAGIYAAASGRRAWKEVLDEVAQALDLWTVQLLGVDKRRGHLIFSTHGGAASPQTALDYFRTYSAIDPRIPLGLSMKGRWMHCHEHLDEAYVAASPFYQEFLIPNGGRYVSGLALLETPEVEFMVGFLRGVGKQPLNPAEMEVVDRVSMHLREAVRNLMHTRNAYAELQMARELLEPFGHPMLLIDETRGIWHRNAAAAEMLEAGDCVTDARGFLTCVSRASDSALTEAVHGLDLSSQDPAATRQRQVVRLQRRDGTQVLAFVSALRPHQTLGVFGAAGRALVVLHDLAKERPGPDPFIVAECFELTPAEARVAVQIARGDSAKDIARRHDVAEATVRKQIQRVLQKAGVERQADLVRVLMELPVRA